MGQWKSALSLHQAIACMGQWKSALSLHQAIACMGQWKSALSLHQAIACMGQWKSAHSLHQAIGIILLYLMHIVPPLFFCCVQGGIQFFVRSVSDGQIVDYLSINIDLKPGENVTNEILTGHHFGESITFTVSFFLTCTFNYYGENCSLYCEPGGSRDHGYYSCSTQGAKICDEYFGGSDCNECDNGFEYPHCWPGR